MTFISHAQNYEDVMLWRALKHIEHGFYIDVGAAWPDEHSVTKAFYERGWHGINIEPNPDLNLQLQERRPKDINLRLAIGDREDTLTMNLLHGTGLTTLDDAIAKNHQREGWSLDRQQVRVTTLAKIWQQHIPAGQEVHFLKVDVEGLEEAVLKGNDWAKNRPWVVIVEATLPMTQVESYETWEPILTAANYHFVYADGLNRFYVADEYRELFPAFKYPPNIFDNFLLSRQQEGEARATQSESRAASAEARATQAEARATQSESRAASAEARATQAEARVSDLLNSTCWRITAPLRWASAAIRRLTPSALKPTVKILFQHAALYVGRRPWLKRVVLTILTRFPGLKLRLRQVVWATTPTATTATQWNQPQTVPTAIAQLTPRARQVYADLKAAIARHKEEG